jgi:hypothetical protein
MYSPAAHPKTKARLPQQKSPKLSVNNNPTGVLFLMTVFILGLVAAYWQTADMTFDIKGFRFAQPASLSDEMRTTLDQRHINRKFAMGGVYLGMSRDMVLQIHTDAQNTTDRSGNPVMLIPTAKGQMVAWLISSDQVVEDNGRMIIDNTLRVYRLRLDEAFAGLSENAILDRYSREYGRPIETACERSGLGDTARCVYNWWGGDGIEVQAIAKKKIDINGRTYTQLTTVATNTITSPKASVISIGNITGSGRWGYLN